MQPVVRNLSDNIHRIRASVENYMFGDVTLEFDMGDGITRTCGPFHTREQFDAWIGNLEAVFLEAFRDIEDALGGREH